MEQETQPTWEEIARLKYLAWVAATNTPENLKRYEERRAMFAEAEKLAVARMCAFVKDIKSTRCAHCYISPFDLFRENLTRWTLAVRHFLTGYRSKDIHAWLVRSHCFMCNGTGVIAVPTPVQQHEMEKLSATVAAQNVFAKALSAN